MKSLQTRIIITVFPMIASTLPHIVMSDDLVPNTRLDFTEKSSMLSLDSKEQLGALIKRARSKGAIKEVQIAVWSDNPTPRPNEELSTSDKELAGKRADSIENYLKTRTHAKIKSYNMAERAGWLERTFNTDEASLKSQMGKAGDVEMTKDEFQVFKDHGQPSRAVVLVILRKKSK